MITVFVLNDDQNCKNCLAWFAEHNEDVAVVSLDDPEMLAEFKTSFPFAKYVPVVINEPDQLMYWATVTELP